MSLRIVFMGTPEFAVPSLALLLEAGYDVAAVITATDKFGGRGGKQLLESAVKKFARDHGLPILQPPRLKDPGFVAALQQLHADLHVVVAFRMLPEIVWNMPPLGTVNLHGSLLPAYRGAAPINWAIINGETETGVTTFLLQHEIDTGDILLRRSIPIGPDETAGELHDRMMHIGAEVILETVRGIETHSLKGVPQTGLQASHAPKIHHDMCKVDFHRDVGDVHNFIRGLSPYPTAWTLLQGAEFKIFRGTIITDEHTLPPGVIDSDDRTYVHVGCRKGTIGLQEVQLQGKRRMAIRDFLNGYHLTAKTLG